MSKRLWTEICHIWAKIFTQKLSKTKAKLSQDGRFGKNLGKVWSRYKGEEKGLIGKRSEEEET